jgi:hypothetical protein
MKKSTSTQLIQAQGGFNLFSALIGSFFIPSGKQEKDLEFHNIR